MATQPHPVNQIGVKMLDCPQCGDKTPEIGTFCMICGKSLKINCPGCQTIVRHAKHCSNCGQGFQGTIPINAVSPKSHKKRLEITPVGGEGHYRIRVQVTDEDGQGVQSKIWIGTSHAYGISVKGRHLVGQVLIADEAKHLRRIVQQLALKNARHFRVPTSVFETDPVGFLECIVEFDDPILEIGFSIVGSDVDKEERILTGKERVVLPNDIDFNATVQAVVAYNRGKNKGRMV